MHGRRLLLLAALGLPSPSCSGDEDADLPTADLARLLVYFPVGQGARGVVRGRGRPGAFPASRVPFAVIRTFPSEFNEVVVPVQRDGSFDFEIVAAGRETLEVAAALDGMAERRGPGAFIEVPPTPLPTSDQVCCLNAGRGACLTRSEAETVAGLDVEAGERESPSCPGPPAPKFACQDDRACLIFERRRYPIDASVFSLSAPDTERMITIEATPSLDIPLVPNGLVLLENRGLSGLGEFNPGFRTSLIAEADGSFRFDAVPARGDDELVLEVVDLNDFRTPNLSLFVPDPVPQSAHLVEVWPVSDLNNGAGAILGLRFFLVGQDGRGLCPDDPELDPAYCHTGGLSSDRLRILNASIDGVSVQLCPAIGPGEPPWEDCANPGGGVERLRLDTPRRGVEGDVRADGQLIAVVVDLSFAVPANRAPYFQGLADYARYLPASNRLSWVFAGGGEELEDTAFMEPAAAADRILEVGESFVPAGANELFGATDRALNTVQAALGSEPRGRVVVTASTPADDLPDTRIVSGLFEQLIGGAQSAAGRPGIPIDVVTIGGEDARSPSGETQSELLATLSQFSGSPERRGRVFSESEFPLNIFDQRRLLRDARGWATGGHLLLYELLPVTVDGLSQIGKLGILQVDVEVTLPGAAALSARYEGPLEFQRVTAD
ncbi:MAG: hypothetical protein AAGD10_11300 [Myxococcota bacterium]